MYQVEILFSGGIIDTATNNGIGTVIGPNGESEATLEAAGWSFSCPTTSRITIGRPGAKQAQPLVDILCHGRNGADVWTKAPNGINTTAFSARQTYNAGAFTTLDIYSINNTQTGVASAGASSVWVTFGLIA
jgi:hypothetical protein